MSSEPEDNRTAARHAPRRIRRRTLLGAGFATAAAGGLAACGAGTASDFEPALPLWYWPSGLGQSVVDQAVTEFAGRAKLQPRTLDGDYLAQLTAVLDSDDAPAIAGIKGEDIPTVLPRADLFVDLNTLGADARRSEYLSWKWLQGTTLDNRLVGFPIDIGPTVLFYRADLFRRAGLADDPDQVATALPDWATFLAAGRRLRQRLKDVRLVANAAELFATCCQQETRRFVDENNRYIGDGEHIRKAWLIAVEAVASGLCAGIANDDERWAAALDEGHVATDTGAAWHSADIVAAAPRTRGKWRVSNGVADGANIGGSFLAIPARGRANSTAYEILEWILSPANQARMFQEAGLFPAATDAFRMPELAAPDPFFGGQRTAQVFAASAAKNRTTFEAPADAPIMMKFADELRLVETGDRTAADAWTSAVATGRELARTRGVLVD